MNSKKQIFFLHFAGGNSYSYEFLARLLDDYEVHQLELPGRGKRTQEPFLNGFNEATQDYIKQIKDKLNGNPFLIFGHSMGAMLGAYVTHELEKSGLLPTLFIASGNPGPGCFTYEQRHTLPKAAFLEELKDIGGMPAEFFEYEELIEYYVPVIKSDFKLLESKDLPTLPPLDTPIVAMMGASEDKKHLIDHWKTLTNSHCETHLMVGNHFFIHQHPKTIADIIKKHS